MSLNLNTGAYAGGQVRFPEFGRELYEAETGGAVVFSCNLLHEALPVTQGRRFALFTFFADAAREKEMIQMQVTAGRQGVSIS
jgi:predicted 2-oxoglutarate/Fe(II)-dependent dioxygenase YbiX